MRAGYTYTVVRRHGKFWVHLKYDNTARKRPTLCCSEGYHTELEAWAFVRQLTQNPPYFISPAGGQRQARTVIEIDGDAGEPQ